MVFNTNQNDKAKQKLNIDNLSKVNQEISLRVGEKQQELS